MSTPGQQTPTLPRSRPSRLQSQKKPHPFLVSEGIDVRLTSRGSSQYFSSNTSAVASPRLNNPRANVNPNASLSVINLYDDKQESVNSDSNITNSNTITNNNNSSVIQRSQTFNIGSSNASNNAPSSSTNNNNSQTLTNPTILEDEDHYSPGSSISSLSIHNNASNYPMKVNQRKSTSAPNSISNFSLTKVSNIKANVSKFNNNNNNAISSAPLTDKDVDRYGFKKESGNITLRQYNDWWREYSVYCIRRKKKWLQYFQKSGITIDEHEGPKRFPGKSDKLKRYVRKGIPAEWRGDAWWYFARGQEILNRNKDLYDALLMKMRSLQDKPDSQQPSDWEIIERDLNRTFPDNVHFQRRNAGQEPHMIQSLRRVLIAFSLYNPHIGYCQSMNFLAGLLLLFLDEEKSFWMLVIITSRYLPNVHNVNLEGVNIDQGVLMLELRQYLPEIWDLINSSSSNNNLSNNRSGLKDEFLYKLPPVTLCTASWFMSCFVGVLPIETTLRIWDCLFYEDSHFLFKISLAIFKLAEPEMLKGKKKRGLYSLPGTNSGRKNFINSNLSLNHNSHNNNNNNNNSNKFSDDAEMEVFQVVQSFPKTLINPNELFEKAIFKRRVALNKLTQAEVDRNRKYVSAQRAKFKHYSEVRANNKDSATIVSSTTNNNNNNVIDNNANNTNIFNNNNDNDNNSNFVDVGNHDIQSNSPSIRQPNAPSIRQDTQSVRQNSPSVRAQNNASIRENSPSIRQNSPSIIEQNAPSIRQSNAPSIRQNAPSVRQTASSVRQTAPSMRQPTPSMRQQTANRANANGNGRDTRMQENKVNEALSSEVKGFKKGLSSVSWNNSIKAKVRLMRRKKD